MNAKERLSVTTRLLPWLVLVVMLSITAWQWDHERQRSRFELHAQFEFALRDTVSRIEQRESAYEQLLRGMQGLFATTALHDARTAQRYVDTLQLDANFYGIQALGVIEYVPAARKEAHLAAMRQQGVTHYALTPPGERDVYAPYIQNIPDVDRYADVLGLDAWSTPVRREAMETARDSGMPAITGKLILAADQGRDAPPGFIMYLPLFAHGQPQNTVSQRRANLIGWVSATFHMDDFMASLYGKPVSGLSIAIYDGIRTDHQSLMYPAGTIPGQLMTSHQPALQAKEYMVVAGQTWTLVLSTLPDFEQNFGRSSDVIIAIFGIGASLVLALLGHVMVVGHARAVALANHMTLELRHMAQHDHLTGLPNRALFSDRVQQKLLEARRHGRLVALVFVDLDRFKPVNDNYGHSVGDQLLQQVAKRLCSAIRASDTVGRIGGDEFVVLLDDLEHSDTALELAEKIRHTISVPFLVNVHEINISCSLGIAVYPRDGTDEATLTMSADRAMYYAKASGRNQSKQVIDMKSGDTGMTGDHASPPVVPS